MYVAKALIDCNWHKEQTQHGDVFGLLTMQASREITVIPAAYCIHIPMEIYLS